MAEQKKKQPTQAQKIRELEKRIAKLERLVMTHPLLARKWNRI